MARRQRNLQTLVNEVLKVKNNSAPKILSNIFSWKQYRITLEAAQHFIEKMLI